MTQKGTETCSKNPNPGAHFGISGPKLRCAPDEHRMSTGIVSMLISAISNIAIAENIKTKETGAGCLNNYALEKCRSILQKDGEIFTDEELYLIYTYLNQMAELSVNEFLKSKS